MSHSLSDVPSLRRRSMIWANRGMRSLPLGKAMPISYFPRTSGKSARSLYLFEASVPTAMLFMKASTFRACSAAMRSDVEE